MLQLKIWAAAHVTVAQIQFSERSVIGYHQEIPTDSD